MYDFSQLSAYDFEILVRDLLEAEYGLAIETFTPGRDGGIDLRSDDEEGGLFIVQCKHMAKSKISGLLSHLRGEEVSKVRALNPSRYILATSLGLTPLNKDAILEVLRPFIRTTADILGSDDINGLLRKHSAVERKHYKLWLTSSTVLERVLHSEIFGRTEAELAPIQDKLRLYVQNDSYTRAQQILDTHHYCIIAGVPGIGKTTLAETLMVAHIAEGYEAYVIGGNIAEAFRVFDDNRPQFYYYDDFLGQSSIQEKLHKNEEQDLLRFLERVRRSSRARMVLTTREYILNQAKGTYEKLARADLERRACVIDLDNYTKHNRAQILYNHLYFSDIPQNVKESVLANGSYIKIILHRNYNPRTIEWMMNQAAEFANEPAAFVETFLKNLDNPSRIWEHAFDHQISGLARILLLVLGSLPSEVYYEDLISAVGQYAISLNPPLEISDRATLNALRELEGTFVRTFRSRTDTVVKFHNPSISDFIKLYISEDAGLARRILLGAAYFEQCRWFFDSSFPERPLHTPANLKMREVLSGCVVNFFSVLRNTFDAVSVGLRNSGVESEPNLRFRDTYPVEDRLGLIVRATDVLARDEAHSILDPYVSHLLAEIPDAHNYDDELGHGLLRLMSTLDHASFDTSKWFSVIAQRTKPALIAECFDLPGFRRFIRFRYRWPKYVTREDFKEVQSRFRDFLHDSLEFDISDMRSVDQLYDYLEDVQEVASDLNVGIKRYLQNEERWADEIERTRDEHEKHLPSLSQEEAIDWGQVGRMFSSLRDGTFT